MNSLMLINNNGVTVDSRQVAEWTGKEHKNVLADIRTEIENLGEIGKLIFQPTSYVDSFNRTQVCYSMGRDGIMQLALKYDAVVRYKVIQKLHELENNIKSPSYMVEDPIERAQRWIEEQKEKKLLAEQRDEAIRTKAHISDKKTASAMGKLGAVVKENKQLKDKLGEGERQATIIAMEKKHGQKFDWRKLRDYCNAHEIDVAKVPDSRYGEVNAYPIEAWIEVYNVK